MRCLLPRLLLTLAFSSPVLGTEIAWRPSYAAARQEAVEKDRPLMLDIGSDDCFWCQRLDSLTFRDPGLIELLNQRFISVRLHATRDATVVNALRVQAYPTLLIATPEGRVIDLVEGFVEAAPFRERLERALVQATPSDGMTRDFEAATQALASSDYPRALPLLRAVVQDGKNRPIQVRARELLLDLEAQAEARLVRSRNLIDKDQVAEAADTIRDLIRVYPETRAATEANRILTTLVLRPPSNGDIKGRKARELLGLAREAQGAGNVVDCLRHCDCLTQVYGNLPEATEARTLALGIRGDPQRMRQACDSLADQLGTMYLALAESWMTKGQPHQAALCLERIIQTLPGTRQAEAAQARLTQIQGIPPSRMTETRK